MGIICLQKTKKHVSSRLLAKICVPQVFWEPIKNSLQGVLFLCQFYYCGFSKLSRYISNNLANAILWAIYFFTAYIHD